MDNFQEKLKQARKAKKLTQKELAEKIETTESNICNYENGRSKPTYEALKKICTELEISADWLLDLKE